MLFQPLNTVYSDIARLTSLQISTPPEILLTFCRCFNYKNGIRRRTGLHPYMIRLFNEEYLLQLRQSNKTHTRKIKNQRQKFWPYKDRFWRKNKYQEGKDGNTTENRTFKNYLVSFDNLQKEKHSQM